MEDPIVGRMQIGRGTGWPQGGASGAENAERKFLHFEVKPQIMIDRRTAAAAAAAAGWPQAKAPNSTSEGRQSTVRGKYLLAQQFDVRESLSCALN